MLSTLVRVWLEHVRKQLSGVINAVNYQGIAHVQHEMLTRNTLTDMLCPMLQIVLKTGDLIKWLQRVNNNSEIEYGNIMHI